MAYKEHGMWEILEVLRRLHRGESHTQIKAATGHSRSSIRRWLTDAVAEGWAPEREPDEALAIRVLARLRPGPKHPGPGQSVCFRQACVTVPTRWPKAWP